MSTVFIILILNCANRAVERSSRDRIWECLHYSVKQGPTQI